MDIKAAQAAIAAILDAIDDDALPAFDKVEIEKGERNNGLPIVWWGGTGHYLGRATTGGVRSPEVLRTSAVWSAIEGEMTYRADKRLFENGDNPKGIRLAKKAA